MQAKAQESAQGGAIQGIHRGGLEILHRRAPEQQTGRVLLGRAFRKDQQDAGSVLANGRRTRRSHRQNDCRHLSGAEQDFS
jgi:hypothetical protein